MVVVTKSKRGDIPAFIRIGRDGTCAISTAFFEEVNAKNENKLNFIFFRFNNTTGKFKFKLTKIGNRPIIRNGFYVSKIKTTAIMRLSELPGLELWTPSIYFTFKEIGEGWYESQEVSLKKPTVILNS